MNLLAEQKIAKLIALLEELRRDTPGVADRVDPLAEAMTKAVDPRAVVTALQTTLDAASAREDGVLAAADPQRVISVAPDADQVPDSGVPGHSGPGR